MAITDNIVSYWKLDESSGNAADSIGSNTLTNNNSTAYVAAKINNGIDIVPASSNSLSVAGVSLVGNAWSFGIWVNTDVSNTNNRTIFSYAPTSGNVNKIQVEGQTDGKLRLIVFNSSGTIKKDYKTATALSTSTWYFLVVTWDGTNLKMFLNGSEETTTKSLDDANTNTNTSRSFKLGSEVAGTNYWDGKLDEAGIWSAALSSTDITTLYNSGNGLQVNAFSVSETLAMTETVSTLRARSFSISETSTLSETWTTLKGIAFSVAESLGLVETFTSSRTFVVGVAESLGIIEVLAQVKKKWNNSTKASSSWTNDARSSSDWINDTKS